ncbi:enoyl-CoA hydratase-related protein [Roseomonas sp. BN140053]|uniref:enoyl-CoA hydratase-related protein n=1 Tax=Roseomonas sp. BN140053 TaxID=3391898 RepID=UPI0039EA81CC
MSDRPETRTERRGAALWVTIDREARRNAINPRVIAGIHAALRDAAADPALRAVVLTGAGEKAFCAGADLSTGTGVFTAGLEEPTTDFGRLAREARELGIPLIARVNGACVAGGMGLMALCDLAVAADHARFGLPEAKVGVFAMQVLVYLRGMIGARHVNELCLTGALIDAARAREMGLINHVVSAAELDAKVEELVAQLAATSPVALRRGKYAIAAMERMAFHEALAFAETQIAVASRTADAEEGLAAFNERRPPRWLAEGGA